MDHTISHYRLLEPLGSGGAGHVWKAEDLRLKRTVAIKVLSPELAADRDAKERMRAEAQIAAGLSHPNIATVYELGEAADLLFIAMECVEGESLRSRMARRPLELKAALDIAIQVADALRAAHCRGLIHCDIKSSNIMITPEELVKVLDFGSAKVASATDFDPLQRGFEATAASHSIEADEVRVGTATYGTVGFMSPEQVRGEPLDQRTDIFSLGVVLYEMLTAKLPFSGETRSAVLRAVLSDEPPPLGAFRDDIPLELEGIIRKALAKERGPRYATAEELLFDLRALRSRFEDTLTSRNRFAGESSRAIAEPTGHSNIGNWTMALRALAWSYRRWLLLGGTLAAALAMWEILRSNPEGTEWAGAAGFLALAGLCALAYAIARRSEPELSGATPGGAAFRGLLPFQEADRNRFYGRETDTVALFEMIRHGDFRFGVLFGESGSGKTSLIRAGLVPKLWDEGYVPIYCRSYKDPLAAALEECRRRGAVQSEQGEPPAEYLRRAAREFEATLVIVCDQFEEFFVSHRSREAREPFLTFIAACHDDSTLPLKFLAAMRSDFLYLISSELGGRIHEPLMSSRLYHLRDFDQAQALAIIEKSARKAGLPIEDGLSRLVARDLVSGDIVSPSELQIVGERLQSKRIYTVQAYRQAGGKEALVHSFLEDVIRAAGDADGARLLLRSLISEENTRVTLTVDQIAKRTQRNEATVIRSLNQFVGARLVREIQEDEPWRYELMHEYLIEKINHITGKVMDATQRANRLLRQYVSNYSVDRKTRVPISKLWFIRRYSDIARSERERELLKKSLRWGLLKSSGLLFLLVAGATLAAAFLSMREEWEGVRLSDGHTAAVRQAVFSPDGRLLVSCGEDKKVVVWDFARRERLATFTDHAGWVTSVAFSPDGKWIASASEDQTVIVWDAARLEKVLTLTDHRGPVNAVAFSPDSRWLASASTAGDDRTIVWSVPQWERFRELPLGVGWADLLFSKDSRLLGSAGAFWDLTTGEKVTESVNPVLWNVQWGALSPDGTRMANIDGLGIVYFWDVTRRKLLNSHKVHRDHGRAIAFSPDGRLAASGAEDIVLWDAATQTKLVRLEHTSIVWKVAFSPDSRWLVSTHGDGSILLWDIAERERVANFNEHSGAVRSVCFSSDGKRIASASDDRSIIIWDAEQRRKEAVLVGHQTRVLSVAFSPDGRSIASGDQDGKLIFWDVDLRQPRWSTEYLYAGRFFSPSYCVTISPDGRWVADSIGVHDSTDGRLVVDFVGDYTGGQIYGADFSTDSRRFVYVTPYGEIFLWDLEKRELLDRIDRSSGLQLISVSLSPDDKSLVTGEDEGVVRLWEVNPLRQVAVIGRHVARIKSVAFSPGGKEVASAGDDQTIALWNVARRSLISRVGAHTAPVLSIAFSPNGKRLTSGEHDGSVHIYTRHRSLWGYRFD